jgi:hypothetical protein
MGDNNQRRHPRIDVDFFADWGWNPNCEFYDRVTSLSVSGCFLATKRELESGREIYMRWSANSGGLINVRGEVRYQLRVMEGAPPTGAGIEFLNVPDEMRQKLQAITEGTE